MKLIKKPVLIDEIQRLTEENNSVLHLIHLTEIRSDNKKLFKNWLTEKGYVLLAFVKSKIKN